MGLHPYSRTALGRARGTGRHTHLLGLSGLGLRHRPEHLRRWWNDRCRLRSTGKSSTVWTRIHSNREGSPLHAIVINGKEDIELAERPQAEPHEGQVRIRTAYA